MQLLTTNLLLTYLSFAALLTVTAMPVNAIEDGEPDTDNAYVSVGALGFDMDGPGPAAPIGVCTGFVISDRAFVTAAHCITTGLFLGAQSWAVTLESGSPEKPIVPPGVFNGGNIFDFPMKVDPELIKTTMIVHLHPQFIPQLCTEESCEYDVAVLEFEAGTFEEPPVRLARFGLLQWLKRVRILKELPIGVVGYGADGPAFDEVRGSGVWIPGYRNRGFSSIARISRTGLVVEPTPIRDSGLMPGDSGSPQFVLGRVVSLNGMADEQRLDIPAVRRFLAPFIWR